MHGSQCCPVLRLCTRKPPPALLRRSISTARTAYKIALLGVQQGRDVGRPAVPPNPTPLDSNSCACQQLVAHKRCPVAALNVPKLNVASQPGQHGILSLSREMPVLLSLPRLPTPPLSEVQSPWSPQHNFLANA
eukprot:4379909-Pleurochrysis_carterae.AAC.2